MPTPGFDINEVKRRMQGATASLKHELGGLRTGRAAASMLEPVQVEAYGSHMPLNQLATVSVPEPRLLSVQVWDKSMVKAARQRGAKGDRCDDRRNRSVAGGQGKGNPHGLIPKIEALRIRRCDQDSAIET